MKVLKIIIILLLLGSIGFVTYRKINSNEDYSKTVHAQIRDIEETLTISGVVQPMKEIEIKSPISGVLEKLSVQVGDEVRMGQDLARVQYVKDPMEYKNLMKNLKVAKTRYDNALQKFQGTSDLRDKRLVSALEYENEKDELSILRAEYEAVKSELNMLRGRYLNAGVSNVIASTATGTILELPIKEGGSVMARGTWNEGSTIAKVADLSSLEFKGEVVEADIYKLKVGMPVTFMFNAASDVKFKGAITLIAPMGFVRDGIARFQVTANINIPTKFRQYLKAGCTANATVVLNRVNKVVALDEKYFQFSDDTVFVEVRKTNGTYEKRYLATGISDGVYTEIKKGLSIKDYIKVKEEKK